MNDGDIRQILTGANPWWRAAARGDDPAAWAATHPLMVDRAKYDLNYRSTVLDDIAGAAPNGSLTVLTGPRRIGKSVALLDTVKSLCAAGQVDPRQIIHVPCDGMAARDLRRTLTLGRDATKAIDVPDPRPRVWFFDEISPIAGWTTVLKAGRDGTEFGTDTVVCTGSRWNSDDDVEGNLMAGRAGTAPGHRVRQLLPMTFREFCTATCTPFGEVAVVHPAILQGADSRAALENLSFLVDDLDLAWQNYLTCGGFPRAVFEHHSTGEVSEAYLRDLAAWLRADVDPEAARDSTLRMVAELSSRMTSPLNVRRTKEALDFSSRSALELRITRLINTHAALQCHQMDEQGHPVAGAQHKLYLTDPVLAWMPNRLSPGLDAPDMTQLNEAAVGVALARAIDALDEGRWVSRDTIGFARTGSGNEVDLAPVRVPTGGGSDTTTPIEGKWVDSGWRGESRTIQGKFGRGIIATKSILDLDSDVWAVPAPAVALLLE